MVSRAVVVGSGSAGHRHAAALRARDPELEIVVVRRPASTQPIERLEALGVQVVPDVETASAVRPDVAVVAGPAPFHRDAAERLARAGAHLLVEKPLAATVADATAIVDAAAECGVQLLVGYHLRFGETVPALKALLDDGAVGSPTGFRLAVGQHLSQWRPLVDASTSVTAREDLGGGVLLELSHELDGLRFLLGEVGDVRASLRTDGAPTDGRVDTVAELEVGLASGVPGSVHLDMVSPDPFRTWTVTGTDGTLVADLLAGTVSVVEASGGDAAGLDTIAPARRRHERHRSVEGERGRAEANLIGHLLDVATGAATPRCTGADGVAAVRLVEAARRSAAAGGGAVMVDERTQEAAARWT